jgi:hypothetical protein
MDNKKINTFKDQETLRSEASRRFYRTLAFLTRHLIHNIS